MKEELELREVRLVFTATNGGSPAMQFEASSEANGILVTAERIRICLDLDLEKLGYLLVQASAFLKWKEGKGPKPASAVIQ